MRPVGLLGISAEGQWGNAEEMCYHLGVTTHVDMQECKKVETPDHMVEFQLSPATRAILNIDQHYNYAGYAPEGVQP